MKKYFISTFGCQMNKSDSERIASVLEKIGYRPASKKSGVDLIVINMCSVRQSAVDRIYGLFPKFKMLKKKNPKLKIILTGCVLKSDKIRFRKYFDLVLDIKDLTNWPQIITTKPGILISQWQDKKADYLKLKPKYKTDFQVFIPISNGCHNACAYCVVPSTRGPLVCRSHKEILKEAQQAANKGYKEIWLLGQNVNDYQSPADPSINFAQLLRMVNNIRGDFWIRFTSPNPKDFTGKIIDAIAQCEKVTEYINIPVQSGDNEILKKMNRPYTVEKYKNLIKKIRQKIPDISLSTDIIVGFPGETKRQFQNTVKLFKEIKFDLGYIAQYSRRPGTSAAQMKKGVSVKEKKERWRFLSQVLQKTALEKNKQYVGKKIKVLVDKQKKGFFYGKTRAYKTVRFVAPNLKSQQLLGQFVTVKITHALPWGLKCEPLNEKGKLPKLIVILGPTASGKTSLAIRLAKEFSGEIVSADSRQIYKEMDIGTAKPTKKELRTVPHHLIDIVSPNQTFSVALYKKMALSAIKDIEGRGKVPFLVGGTGLYIQAIVDNLTFPKIAAQRALRNKLELKDKKELFQIYRKLDPQGAQLIDKENKRRLIRAIEVCKATGKPFWQQRKKEKPLFNTLQFGLKLSPQELKKRISKRTNRMIASGLEKETKKLEKKYSRSPLLQTIGYQECFALRSFGEGRAVEDKLRKIKESIKLHTLQFAKRQMTWFKRDKGIHWIKTYPQAKKLVKAFLKN